MAFKFSYLILALAFLFPPNPSWAQYDLAWIRNFGEAGEDEGKCVLPSQDGNIWVIGAVQKNAVSKADAWIIKVNESGRNLWDVRYGGKKWDAARTAITTEDGGLVVLGITESKGEGKSDIWLFKLDSEGNMLWDKTYGDKNWDEGYALAQAQDGGFIIGGSYKPEKKEDDLWVIRTDERGNVLWDIRLGDKEWEGIHDILVLPNGGFMLAGYIASEKADKNHGWLLKVSDEGKVLWSKLFGGPSRDAIHDLLQLNDSTLLAAGFSRSEKNDADMWLINTDLDGNMRWERTIGGKGFEKARRIIQTIDGHLLFVGYTHSQGLGNGDAWVVKTTVEGKKLWEKTFGGAGFDKAFGITELADGCVVLVGNIHLGTQQNILTIKLSPNNSESP